ncbi:MAG: DUF3782 domain-containing protein [Candidatus Thorarchaeota archaeon]|nr:DUF3782 domain-containing protein [Candidatus Thorarchaeota archaeon]
MGSNESSIPASQIEAHLRKVLPDILREITIVYSPEELVTKKEFQEALQLMQERFEAMDKRFEEIIDLMDKRFEAVDKRFEEIIDLMDKRFEAVDKRFEAVDKRFEEIIDQMAKRAEAVDKRFEDMNRRFEEMNRHFEAMVAGLQKGFDSLRRDVSTISTRFGIRLEDIFREVFREALLSEDLDPEKIRRLDVLDEKGVVVPPGEVTDIDMMVHDSQCVFVEVKSHMDMHDIWKFIKTVELAEMQEGVKATKLVAVTLDISPRDRIKAEKLGIRVITSDAGPH